MRSEHVEVGGGLRKLHGEKFHNLYFSCSIVWIIKSKGMK